MVYAGHPAWRTKMVLSVQWTANFEDGGAYQSVLTNQLCCFRSHLTLSLFYSLFPRLQQRGRGNHLGRRHHVTAHRKEHLITLAPFVSNNPCFFFVLLQNPTL